MVKIIKHFWREFKSGELNLFALCIIIAISASTTVSFFSNRVNRAISLQSNEILAADLRLASSRPLAEIYTLQAHKYNLETSFFSSLQGIMQINDQFILAEIKAVTANYPLRGRLKTKLSLSDEGVEDTSVPSLGTLWVDAALFNDAKLKIGQILQLGEASFKLEKILDFEPDRGGDVFNIAPRVMLNQADLEATKLILPGSRIRYTLLLKGAQKEILQFQKELVKDVEVNIQDIENAQPQLKAALVRSEKFMNLAALISLVLASCGIGLSAHQFALKRRDMVGILTALGVAKNIIFSLFAGSLLILAVIASVLGALIGYIAQMLLANFLTGFILQSALPEPSLMPIWTGISIGLITTLGFAIPPIWSLRQIEPMRVLRQNINPEGFNALKRYLPAYICLCVLFIWRAGSLKLGLTSILGLSLSLGLLWIISALLLKILVRLRLPKFFYIGQKNILYRRQSSILQMSVIGFGLMILLLLTVIKQDLIKAWDASIPLYSPNQFMINIPPEAVDPIKNWLTNNSLEESLKNPPVFYPIVRGRITTINGQPFSADAYEDDNAKRLARREFNMSWISSMPEGNTLVSGHFPPLSQDGVIEISIEESRIAKGFNFKLGDEIGFNINGNNLKTKISSIRNVDWQKVNLNFFILFPDSILNQVPATWVTAFYWPNDLASKQKLMTLIKTYPAITLIDVGTITLRIKAMIDKISLAITALFGFTLAAGILVLFTAIQTTQEVRIREIALFKTFGADKKVLRNALLSEFTLLGCLSGLLASLFAYVIAFILMNYVFDLKGIPQVSNLLLGTVGGLLVVLISGYFGCRRFLNYSPMRILRNF